MKKVLLYFGSFNPIHKGHIALAEWVVEQGLFDELMSLHPNSPAMRCARWRAHPLVSPIG